MTDILNDLAVDGKITATGDITDGSSNKLSDKVNKNAIVTAFQGTPDNTHIASEKLVKDSLDLKIDTSAIVSAWQVTPDDSHIPSEKLVKTYIDTSLTDGSVTKIGTATVGGNLKPIYLNAGVPTAVANDLVDVSSAQTITNTKKLKSATSLGLLPVSGRNDLIQYSDDTEAVRTNMIRFIPDTTNSMNFYTFAPGNNGLPEIGLIIKNNGSSIWAEAHKRTYNPSNTDDIVTIGSLQASSDVVHRTGNETIDNTKTFLGVLTRKADYDGNGDLRLININNTSNVEQGYLYIKKLSDGKRCLFIGLKNSDNSTYSYIELGRSS